MTQRLLKIGIMLACLSPSVSLGQTTYTAPSTMDVSNSTVVNGSTTTNLQTLLSNDSSVQNSLGYSLLFANDPSGTTRITPTVKCPGNGNFGNTTTVGLFCLSADTNPTIETYVGQIAVNNVTPATVRYFNWTTTTDVASGASSITVTPATTMAPGFTYTITGTGIAIGTTITTMTQSSDATSTTLTLSSPTTASIPSGSNLTGESKNGTTAVLDPVGIYAGIKNKAYTTEEWAANFLADDNMDGGGTGSGVVEIDSNNFNCDNPNPAGEYHTGTSTIRSSRSDGSKCPLHVGLGITGLAGYTSGNALSISGVPNGTRNMWETGITMIGGSVIGSSEIWTETSSNTMWSMRGNHYTGLDSHDATFKTGFANLPMDSTSGRIFWSCPTSNSGCSSFNPSIYPNNGSLTLNGSSILQRGIDALHVGGLGIDVTDAVGTTATAQNDWSWLTWVGGKYTFNFADATTLNTPLAITSSTIALNAATTLSSTLVVKGSSYFQNTIEGNGSGPNTTGNFSQGYALAWNVEAGLGETDFINIRGGGSGGFSWYNNTISGWTTSVGTPIMNLTGDGNLIIPGYFSSDELCSKNQSKTLTVIESEHHTESDKIWCHDCRAPSQAAGAGTGRWIYLDSGNTWRTEDGLEAAN